MTTPRVAGKYGCLAPKFPVGLRELVHYAEVSLPMAPASVAVPAVADWDVDGNDTYGDCGVAGLNHLLMAAASDTSQAETFPAADQVVSYYLTYTGGQDSGVVLSDFLAYVAKTGFYGHTVAAYAPVAVSDIPTLQFAVNAYDAAYTGITVTQAMEQAFSAGQPWTLETAQGDPVGGHCVPIVGYDTDYLYAVTWGQVQAITYDAWQHIASEAWAVITGELAAAGADGHGIDLAALQADLSRLDDPAPVQPPTPVTPPAPEPDHKSLLAELVAIVREDAAKALAWLEKHGL